MCSLFASCIFISTNKDDDDIVSAIFKHDTLFLRSGCSNGTEGPPAPRQITGPHCHHPITALWGSAHNDMTLSLLVEFIELFSRVCLEFISFRHNSLASVGLFNRGSAPGRRWDTTQTTYLPARTSGHFLAPNSCSLEPPVFTRRQAQLIMRPSPRRPHYALHSARLSVCLSRSVPTDNSKTENFGSYL